MLRSLIQKLPKLSTTNDYAVGSAKQSRRNCRSLSPPVNRKNWNRMVNSEIQFRSVSCSPKPRGCSLAQIQESAHARNLCFSKDYYANNETEQKDDELHWRENLPKESEMVDLPSPQNAVQVETLEQYELEAARPRPMKSYELMEAFNSKLHSVDPHCHLQPNQMKPYGSSDNYYSPMLIRPTNSLKFPRKLKKPISKDDDTVQRADSKSSVPGKRNFSTSPHISEAARGLATSKNSAAKKQNSATKHSNVPKLPSFGQPPQANFYSDYWNNLAKGKKLDFLPPKFPSKFVGQLKDEAVEVMESSTPEMRRQRAAEENRRGSDNYKLSYSDLVKLKMQDQEKQRLVFDTDIVTSEKKNAGSIMKSDGNKMLEAFKNLRSKRTMTTRSKSTLSAKSVNKKSKKKKNKQAYNPACEDVCTETVRLIDDAVKARSYPYEPKKCEPEQVSLAKRVFLPSKVRLAVPPCTPRPDYRDCQKVEVCAVERADDCLEPKYKPLPKLEPGPCPCIDPPHPTYSPKLQKLQFKFEDPPRAVCHVPPCQTPRADDTNPHKYKKLKPHKPQDCACVEPPPLVDVKLKRLPRCEPEEVCRPVRVCPEPHKCPPRADDNLKISPKKLPPMEGALCPCVEPPTPTIAPAIRRLDLSVPDPERVCLKKPVCADTERADDRLALKRKKLPTFVPGDCPCEDRPMLDWNLKRLVCEDEARDCIVPDPCNAMPRADWGCWEYEQEECLEVDEKCVDKRKVKCPPPEKPKAHACKDNKKNVCGTWTTTDMNHHHKRKFSNAGSNSLSREFCNENLRQCNSSSTVQQKVADQSKPAHERKPPHSNNHKKLLNRRTKKGKCHPLLNLIEVLNSLELPGKATDPLLFKPEKRDRVNYERILEAIASSTPKIMDKKDPKSARVSIKKTGITVSSRAISTTENVRCNNEIDMKKKKDTEAKEKCKKIKPTIKALMCQKACPRYTVCPDKTADRRAACKVDRVPVCCTKEESPYSAYTDNLPTTMRPFVTKTPQFNCSRTQYGYYPNFKKEFEPLDVDNDKKKPQADKKNFSTSAVYKGGRESPSRNSSRQLSFQRPNPAQQSMRLKVSRYATAQPPSKDLLTSNHRTLSSQNRTLTTKVFQIHFPVCPKKVKPSTGCANNDSIEKAEAPKIVCYTDPECKAYERRPTCHVEFRQNAQKRREPPFPAFSDCLDEEMEEILTECPLDREKYLRMQPRFMNPPPKPFNLKPPPPVQGKIDILKEQKCIRDKLCMENEGFTQTCTDFGKPVPLMKSKTMFPEVNWDCKRIVELKKLGRWPPFTLKSNRRFSTSACDQTRHFHVLSKGIDKNVLKHDEDKEKAGKDKLRLDKNKLDENALSHNKLFIKEIKQNDNNVAKRVRRFYTTYKINKKRSFGPNNRSSRQLSNSPVSHKFDKLHRGNRRSSKSVCKKPCPKFTLKNCPARSVRRSDCQKISQTGCSKPIITSPYPAYSECTDHTVVAPECECAYDLNTMEDLQPRFAIINEPADNIKHFPSQEKINRAVAWEYYKRKHGIVNEGVTIGCDCLPPTETVEFLVQDHKAAKETNVCSQSSKEDPCSKDREMLEGMCIRECIKQMPCHLPEEEKYCVCKERCEAYFRQEDAQFCPCPEEDVVGQSKCIDCEQDEASKPPIIIDYEASKPSIIDCEPEKPPDRKNDCAPEKPPVEIHCEQAKPPDLKIDCKPKIKPHGKIDCEQEPKTKLKHVECIAPPPKCNPCKQMVAKAAPCARKPTQLEALWQKIVNFFKARPNCPEPGDYKKKALRDRAEKAASALGLVVVDPKCLPQDMLKGLKVPKRDCKACPDQKRSFSTIYQQLREYSNSCKNLEEINRMLEEDSELKQNEPTVAIFPERRNASAVEAFKMSLDFEVYNYADSEWCHSECPRAYFGYSGVIPSKENILERAWRISIDAYNTRNYPKTYSFFNEFFNKVDRSANTYEDLEKSKTEKILRELDELLKIRESSKKK